MWPGRGYRLAYVLYSYGPVVKPYSIQSNVNCCKVHFITCMVSAYIRTPLSYFNSSSTSINTFPAGHAISRSFTKPFTIRLWSFSFCNKLNNCQESSFFYQMYWKSVMLYSTQWCMLLLTRCTFSYLTCKCECVSDLVFWWFPPFCTFCVIHICVFLLFVLLFPPLL